jgi:aldehyde:ferredoxin oxidoreductase
MFGYHGRYLRVDVSTGESRLVPLEESVCRRFLGGVGLGTWILARELRDGVDPLDPEAVLVVSLSSLVGSPLTTSAKFAVLAISPLTNRLCDALSSSHFAIAAKRAGVDALVLTGACPGPAILRIDGLGRDSPRVLLEDARPLWGRPAREAEQALRLTHGPDWQVLAIGTAGESLVPFATLSHDGRHAGRGGLGAVLGSKRLKAVAVRGDRRTPVADPERTVALARDLSSRSFGPATAKYRELGTVANLLLFNRLDALPSRNFASGRIEGVQRLAAEDLGPARRVARKSCAACTIGCEHVYAAAGERGVRMEYESLFALGPLCGVTDPAAVLRAADACDSLGLDTISTGGTIAFLMDCVERGWLKDDRLPSGRPLRFGDGAAVLEAVENIPLRAGLGRLLSLGSRRAAERIGGRAPERAMHVKGLELPGYHPPSLQTMALGLAVATRGADHNRSGAYEADFSARVDRRHLGPESVAEAIASEDRAALIDSLILCKFLRGVFDDIYTESADMLGAVTGWSVTADELRTLARRVVNARKCVNQRRGWTRAEDVLPAGLFESEPDGSPFSASHIEAMVSAYYGERGWDSDGRVPYALRTSLALESEEFGPADSGWRAAAGRPVGG